MAKVLVPLANGFEELEAITIIDLLRRAGIEVITAGLDEKPVTASRKNVLIPDTSIDKVNPDEFDMVILPGGLPGADNLRDSPQIQSILQHQYQNNKPIAAICAAPKALAKAGILKGKTITCYPGALDQVDTSQFNITEKNIEIDGNIITSRGPGTAMDFALTLIELLASKTLRNEVETQLVRG